MIHPSREKLKGRYVTFFVRDIHQPQPMAILHELHADEQLRGQVLDLSADARADGDAFVIVKVPRVRELCIVSVGAIRGTRRPKARRHGHE